MDSVTLDAARAAKVKLAARLGGTPELTGIGITRVGQGFSLKVNLTRGTGAALGIPAEIDGVPVVVEVVGTIRKQ